MTTTFPNEFLEKIQKIYTPEELEIIQNGFHSTKRKTSFRVNTLKSNAQEIEKVLEKHNIAFQKVAFLKNAYILENADESDLWDLEIYKNGKIYLQSISSQLPIDILDINDFDKILDITAAPGWKTSQAAALLKNTGEIIANDNNSIRIDKLTTTIKKQWCQNVEVIKTDARLIAEKYPQYEGYFQHIIADLPCSAEWKFNINKEKSFAFWNPGVVKRNFKLQKEIIKSIIPMLANWGTLIYSTCTLSPEENEEIVHMILSCFPELELQDIPLEWKYFKKGLTSFNEKVYRKTLNKTLRILPSEETEWFYIAKFTKIKEEA